MRVVVLIGFCRGDQDFLRIYRSSASNVGSVWAITWAGMVRNHENGRVRITGVLARIGSPSLVGRVRRSRSEIKGHVPSNLYILTNEYRVPCHVMPVLLQAVDLLTLTP